MADNHDLLMVEPHEVHTLTGVTTAREIQAQFPKTSVSAADFQKAQQNWLNSVPTPTATPQAPKPIQGVKITASDVEKLQAIHESPAATAEMAGQQLGPDQVLGILHSSLAAFEYTRLKSEHQQLLATSKDKAAVEAQWKQIVSAAQQANAAAGLKNLSEADLDKMASELGSKKPAFNAVVTIANSATAAEPQAASLAAGATHAEGIAPQALGNFITYAAVLPDLVTSVTAIQSAICTKPIQGTFTRHFGKSFQLQVSLTVWCPTWTNPFRTCKKTFTLAGVSFNVDLSIGYRITCCGATVWGQAAAQACGTVIGIKVCASCTATVAAVTGTGKTGTGSSCQYGLGISAELKCQFAGVTLFDVHVPFGWTIAGPCLPPC